MKYSVSALLVLLIFASGCIFSDRAETVTYKSASGWAIFHPSEWRIDDARTHDFQIFYPPTTNESYVMIYPLFNVYANEVDGSFGSWLEGGYLEGRFSEFQLVEGGEFSKIDDRDAYYLVYTYSGNRSKEIIIFGTQKENKAYSISLNTRLEDFEMYEKTFDYMVMSFNWP